MREDRLILVDLLDTPVGEADKLQAHQKSLLHRAFSVFLYRGDEMLIQKRAAGKYHSAGLWANTCCSHPRVGEGLEDAVSRRLWDDTLSTVLPKRIEITGEAYREFCENPYHPFRILPRALIRAEAENGRYYLRYMDAPTEEKAAEMHRFSNGRCAF